MRFSKKKKLGLYLNFYAGRRYLIKNNKKGFQLFNNFELVNGKIKLKSCMKTKQKSEIGQKIKQKSGSGEN